MKTYRKKRAIVKAKLFEKGDEDGISAIDGSIEMYGIKLPVFPYIKTLENQYHIGEFLSNYICHGIDGERWLVRKDIFESEYEEV